MDIRERLGLVKSSLALLVQHLRDDDTIAIVTYGDDARRSSHRRRSPTPSASSPPSTSSARGQHEHGGRAAARVRAGPRRVRPAALNVVVLASDGVANVGVTDPAVLTDEITQAGEEGIHLVTVGYGMGNYNDHLMEQLADQGDGFYGYVDTFEEAERLFVDELTPTLTVVAAEAKAQVVFDPAVVAAYRLVGYENRGLDDEEFRDDTVDAGELGAGHAVTALYEVVSTTDDAVPAALRAAAPRPTRRRRGHGALARSGDRRGGERAARSPLADGGRGSPSLRLAATVAELAEVLRATPTSPRAASRSTSSPPTPRRSSPTASPAPTSWPSSPTSPRSATERSASGRRADRPGADGRQLAVLVPGLLLDHDEVPAVPVLVRSTT